MSTYPEDGLKLHDEERRLREQRKVQWETQQQGLQNQQWPPGHLQAAQQPYNQHADPRGYGPYQPIQQPPGYSPLSEADVQRIAIAVVARLEALRAAADRL